MIKKQTKQFTSILFVPPTPDSELLKDIQKRNEELNKNEKEQNKFVEKGGIKIEKLVTNKNPSKPKNTLTNGAPYVKMLRKIESKKSKRVYEGETSRAIRIRAPQRTEAYNFKSCFIQTFQIGPYH